MNQPIRLAFNATALLSPLTGIGQYSYHLAHEILVRQDIDAEFFYGAFWDRQLRASPSTLASALPWLRRHLPYSYELRRWLQSFRFDRHAKRYRFDVYHEPNILRLPFDGPSVVTVHDLSWIRYPEAHPAERVRAMNRYFETGLKLASAIITDSLFVKQELIDVFGVAPSSISAIPLGVAPGFIPLAEEQTREVLKRHQLIHGQYFLSVGTLEPRKNLVFALQAYQRLPARVRQRFPMVIIGMKGWHTSAIEQQMSALEKTGQLRRLDYVPRAELSTLMAGALALVYPSIYEGFGLPPLEAMACGVPVICANASSLPEVVGDTGVLIDPLCPDELVEALMRAAEGDLSQSGNLARARERAMNFTWANCAGRTVEVYRSICP
ncbi:MAG: glycosyltransferase family 1 protein [Azonexus sp.]